MLPTPRSLPLVAAVVATFLCALLASPLAAQPVDGPADPDALAAELWERLDLLARSVIEQDTAGLDDAVCLEDLLHARLVREEALGLVVDAADPALVQARRAQVREDVREHVARLIDEGEQVVAIDIGRVDLPGPGAGGEEESLSGEGAEELAITGAGLLGLEMQGLDRSVDLGLFRLRDRWCFDPFSMASD